MARVPTPQTLDQTVQIGNTAERLAIFKHATAGSTSLRADVTNSAGAGNSQDWYVDGVRQASYGLFAGAFHGFSAPNDIFFGLDTASAYVLLTPAVVAIGGSLSAGPILSSSLTSGRVVIAGASGILADDADLTFSGDTLSVTKLNVGAGDNTGDNVTFGTYTPTRSAEANLDANVTPSLAQYVRLGSVVTVSGEVAYNPTTTLVATSFQLSLPIASNIGATSDLAGAAVTDTPAAGSECMRVKGSVANDTAVISWIPVDVNAQTMSYTYTYRII